MPLQQWGVRSCVIFNPTAKGEKAKKFRKHLDEIATESTLKLTREAGDARRLACEAVREGFEIVVAAGGDGTLNEVVNGLGDAPGGFAQARLGVLPLGTVNVFARELGISTNVQKAWEIIRQGHEKKIDLPFVEFGGNGSAQRRYFAQLAGAGLDARAIELVQWKLKKKIGPLAYVVAGIHALAGPPAVITAGTAKTSATGGLVLVGNGRLYGGQFRVFPEANLQDGLLDVCVFPKVNWMTLARCGPSLLVRGVLPASATVSFRAESFALSSPGPVPLEVDGDLIGHLPARFSVQPLGLRVNVP